MEYFADEWNRPSRSDKYLQQVAMEACRSRLAKPGEVQMKDFELKFVITEAETKPAQPVEGSNPAEVSKAIWCGRLGVKYDGPRK